MRARDSLRQAEQVLRDAKLLRAVIKRTPHWRTFAVEAFYDGICKELRGGNFNISVIGPWYANVTKKTTIPDAIVYRVAA